MAQHECKHKSSCEMYQLLKLSGTRKTWQTRYCDADFSECARFQEAAKGRPVPINLMPNGKYLNVPGKD